MKEDTSLWENTPKISIIVSNKHKFIQNFKIVALYYRKYLIIFKNLLWLGLVGFFQTTDANEIVQTPGPTRKLVSTV